MKHETRRQAQDSPHLTTLSNLFITLGNGIFHVKQVILAQSQHVPGISIFFGCILAPKTVKYVSTCNYMIFGHISMIFNVSIYIYIYIIIYIHMYNYIYIQSSIHFNIHSTCNWPAWPASASSRRSGATLLTPRLPWAEVQLLTG